MKRLLCLALTAACSCTGFRALDRGDWVLVWSDESVSTQVVNGASVETVKPSPGARQQIIPLARYESEVSEGKRHSGSASLGHVPKHLAALERPLALTVGEVRELIVDEAQQAQLYVAGDCVRPYWTQRRDVSDGKTDPASKESSLFLLADEPGSAQLKVVYPGKKPRVLEVEVYAK